MGQLSRSDVERQRQVGRLAPRISDFIGRPGFEHRREPDPQTGKMQDVVSWKPHDGDGRLTRQAREVNEAMQPFARADTERWKGLEARREREAVVDAAGAVYHLEAHVLEGQKPRWHSPGRITGILATTPQGDFCPICDLRGSWCECTRGRS